MKKFFCLYCDKELPETGLYHPECFNTEYAINLRRYAFLTGYAAKNKEEIEETKKLKEFFLQLGKDPRWHDVQRDTLSEDEILKLFLSKT
jgi:hypothetical protein